MKNQEILYKIQGVIFLGDGMAKKRCVWCNEKNEKYVCYHDKEWGVLNLSDSYLFEMLLFIIGHLRYGVNTESYT